MGVGVSNTDEYVVVGLPEFFQIPLDSEMRIELVAHIAARAATHRVLVHPPSHVFSPGYKMEAMLYWSAATKDTHTVCKRGPISSDAH